MRLALQLVERKAHILADGLVETLHLRFRQVVAVGFALGKQHIRSVVTGKTSHFLQHPRKFLVKLAAVANGMIQLVGHRTVFVCAESVGGDAVAPFHQMLLLSEIEYLQDMVDIRAFRFVQYVEQHLHEASFVEICHNLVVLH